MECVECGHVHDQKYVWCHSCMTKQPMEGKYANLNIWMPRHFTAANEGGYTQRELEKETFDHARATGEDLERAK